MSDLDPTSCIKLGYPYTCLTTGAPRTIRLSGGFPMMRRGQKCLIGSGRFTAKCGKNLGIISGSAPQPLLCLLPHIYRIIWFVSDFQASLWVSTLPLGGLAAAVTLRKEPSVGEKALWIVAITILMFAEIHNLYVEAERQNGEAKKVSDALDKTNQGLSKTLTGLDGIVNKLQGISTGINEAINNETGGDSYVMFAIGEPFIQKGVSGDHFLGMGMRYNKPIDIVSAVAIAQFFGKYPLPYVHASISGPIGPIFFEYDFGPLGPNDLGRSRPFPYLEFVPENKPQYFHIAINCSNGNYYQGVMFIKVNGRWEWETKLYKTVSAQEYSNEEANK